MTALPFARLALILIGLLAAQTSHAAIAMVTDLRGQASVSSWGRGQTADLQTLLALGAELRLTAGTKLSLVYFEGTREFRFKGPTTIRLGREGPSGDGAIGSRSLKLGDAAWTIQGAGEQFKRAILDRKKINNTLPILTLFPKDTVVSPEAIRFAWKPREGVYGYELEVNTGHGERLFVKTMEQRTQFTMKAPLYLPPGSTVKWLVRSTDPDRGTLSHEASFEVGATGQLLRELGDLPDPRKSVSEAVLHATILEQRGRADLADRLWKTIAGLRPDSPLARARVAPPRPSPFDD